MCRSRCGCAELESVPPKDSEMERLASASLHQIRLRPCVKGSCLFLSSFSLSKGQTSRPRIVPRSLLSHIIYGYSTTDGCSKGLGYTVDIGMRGCSLSAKWYLGTGQNWSKSSRLTAVARREIYEKVYKGGEKTKKSWWSLCDFKWENRKYNIGKRRFGTTTDADWMFIFAPLQLRGRWNKSASSSELMWNMWWSVTAWVMTALLSYKLQSRFDNGNGVLPGQIFVRRERKLYVKI